MNGKICVVTGATSGIGRATAIGLARPGARIVILARNPAKAASIVAEIAAIAGAAKAEIVLADLTEMKQVQRGGGNPWSKPVADGAGKAQVTSVASGVERDHRCRDKGKH